MEKCVACGKMALIPETLGKVTFCKMCALKIQIPFWKNKFYDNLDEFKNQRRKIISSASSKGFPKEAVEGINDYFDAEEGDGFIASIDGCCGQTLKIYREYCVISTDKQKFDINAISIKYAKILQSTQTRMGFFDNPDTQKALM